MTALIIEDELPSARKLERLLKKMKVDVVSNLTSIKDSVNWLKKNKQPDLLFLDIQLSDGLCFTILENVVVKSKIIFTTAFPKYSVKAFDFNGISYLLKPLDENKLKDAIIKANQIRTKEKEYSKLKEYFKNFNLRLYKQSFTVKVGKKIKIINTKEINFFYSFDNATFANLSDGNFIISQSLTSLENDLNPEQFFRVNRTFIVNINAIKDILAYTNSRLKLVLNSYHDSEIIVSRERVKDFKNWIE